ncbi:HAD family hydrolase [Kitasatospora phosalacinea]|uniref:HAD family hydrolase n=1 Tax=Kitasatospora phosalacinea TaxID=2065 RepID=UPI0035D58915
MRTRPRCRGVLLDLDDTLYPQAAFLAAAWDAVAAAAPAELRAPLRAALDEVCAQGSDRGRTVDRALEQLGITEGELAGELVGVFRAFRPVLLDPHPGVVERLVRLAEAVPLVVLTDGNPPQQRAKLAATGLAPLLPHVVCTDELPGGRAARKPAPDGFRRALELLGRAPGEVLMVGDRPDKDVAGAARLGIPVIRVRQGEYREQPDRGVEFASLATAAEALDLVLEAL